MTRSFKDFIANEARRGPAPGAFGKSGGNFSFSKAKPQFKQSGPRPTELPSVSHGRQDNRFQNFDQRVAYGKNIEALIIKSLVDNFGWQIKPASANDDMVGKIDGYILRADKRMMAHLPTQNTPIQVKYRDSGSDLLMEVVKPWSIDMIDMPIQQIMTGRDMVGRAMIYVCLDPTGSIIRVRSAIDGKKACRTMLMSFMEQLRKDPTARMYKEGGDMLRMVFDPRNNTPKINAFLNPGSPFFSWKEDYKLPAPIWSTVA